MAHEITIFHNPRCSKSRQALSLLQQHGADVEVVEYLKRPLTVEEILGVLRKLDVEPHALLRPREDAYAEVGLAEGCSAEQVASAIALHPMLLERPVIVRGDRAVIGRPPERALELLA